MGKAWRQWMENKGLERFFRKENLLILILGGVLLFIIALPTKPKAEAETGETGAFTFLGASEGENGSQNSGGKGNDTEEKALDTNYAADLERRLTDTLSEMAQVGRVKVMITLKSSCELVVEKETPVTRSATTETDSQGGSRTVNTSEMGETVVYTKNGNSSEPYVVKTYVPEIEGVLVVAEGAGSGTVNRTVTEIVQALFGIEAHKVKVVKMGSIE